MSAKKFELMIATISVIIAAIALIPQFGQWIGYRPKITDTPTNPKNSRRSLVSDTLNSAGDNMKAGNYSEAIREVSLILMTDPNNISALILRQLAYTKLKYNQQAIEDANHILNIQPNNAFILRYRSD